MESRADAKDDVTTPTEVVLDVATPRDAVLLANLLELYIHDLSEVFPLVELGEDGRFGYEKLPLYWSEPEHRFPFLIRCGTRVVGFVLVTRGSPVSNEPDVFDVAELFVMRRYRRSGVGRRAILLLWDRLPGRWIVRVSDGNAGALPFWERVIAEHTSGTATLSTRSGTPSSTVTYGGRELPIQIVYTPPSGVRTTVVLRFLPYAYRPAAPDSGVGPDGGDVVRDGG
jgi:predicted acetyltransferase